MSEIIKTKKCFEGQGASKAWTILFDDKTFMNGVIRELYGKRSSGQRILIYNNQRNLWDMLDDFRAKNGYDGIPSEREILEKFGAFKVFHCSEYEYIYQLFKLQESGAGWLKSYVEKHLLCSLAEIYMFVLPDAKECLEVYAHSHRGFSFSFNVFRMMLQLPTDYGATLFETLMREHVMFEHQETVEFQLLDLPDNRFLKIYVTYSNPKAWFIKEILKRRDALEILEHLRHWPYPDPEAIISYIFDLPNSYATVCNYIKDRYRGMSLSIFEKMCTHERGADLLKLYLSLRRGKGLSAEQKEIIRKLPNKEALGTKKCANMGIGRLIFKVFF